MPGGAIAGWPRQIARHYHNAADLPDVSKSFREIAQGIDRLATLHGVVFDILVRNGKRGLLSSSRLHVAEDVGAIAA
jgi:hypothetical protein